MQRKNFIWRGEEIIVEKDSFANILVDGLNEVFKNGFKQTGLDTEILSVVFKPLPETYITASSTKCSDGEFIGRDNELVSAGTYGYIYLVEAKNITTVDVPKEKGAYAIVSKIDPNFIVGAMPSAFVAFALGLAENSFIINPAYEVDPTSKEAFYEKINKVSGAKLFSTFSALTLKYPSLNLDEVYQNYLNADEERAVQANSSPTFFPRQPQSSESPPASSEYGSYQCGR